MQEQLQLFGNTSGEEPAVPTISGMSYCPNLLSQDEQKEVLSCIDTQPWLDDLKRRVQHYGFKYNYKARRVDQSMRLGPLPAFAIDVACKLVQRSLLSGMPDQLIVNEYLPGQGISAHIDCEPCFGDKIAMVSLGWAYEMEFIQGITRETKSILLEKGSALVISGPARYEWLHQIKAKRSDRGKVRGRRVSLTFRTVVLNDSETGRVVRHDALGRAW